MNLTHWIIKKLGGYTENEMIIEQWFKNILEECNKGTYHKLVAEDYGKSFPTPPETIFYGTSHSKLPKDITQEDLNKWYKRKDEKDK